MRVSDGYTKVYLDPDEFDEFSDDGLTRLLVAARREARGAALGR